MDLNLSRNELTVNFPCRDCGEADIVAYCVLLFNMAERNSTFKQRIFNFLLRFGVFGTFVTVGMIVIVAIEKTGNEEKQRKSKLLSDLQMNMTLKYNLTRKEFDLLADAIYDAKSPAPVQWTYGRGFSFVIQLVTTIGKLWLEILNVFASPVNLLRLYCTDIILTCFKNYAAIIMRFGEFCTTRSKCAVCFKRLSTDSRNVNWGNSRYSFEFTTKLHGHLQHLVILC